MTSTQSEETSSQDHKFQRRLRARHLNMIAIGGAIGTGLLVTSGVTILQAGPGDALIAHTFIGIMVWLVMQSPGEVAAYLPVPGSFQEYGRQYASESFGFATGWDYWFNWVITAAIELAAAALVMRYRLPDVSSIVWSAPFLAILFGLNVLPVRVFGEGKSRFATIKVIIVIIFLVLGVGMILGILGGSSPGLENWITGDAPFVNGGMGLLVVFIVTGYSFQGTEMVSVAAGEAEDPECTIPRAIRTIFWRILLLYIGAIAVIGFLIAYMDLNLLSAAEDNISISPLTLVFERASIAIVAGPMNTVILASVPSAGNSGTHVSTRMLFSLARQGHAPRYFGKFSGHGVPLRVLVATAVIGTAGFITSLVGDGAACIFLLTLSGLAGFTTWFDISFSHYRFHKCLKAQNIPLDSLPCKASFFPAGAVLALIMCFFVVAGQAFDPTRTGESIFVILTPYLGIPVFVLLWFIYKKATGSRFIDPVTADMSRGQLRMAVNSCEQ